jgi:hypothetical protein
MLRKILRAWMVWRLNRQVDKLEERVLAVSADLYNRRRFN